MPNSIVLSIDIAECTLRNKPITYPKNHATDRWCMLEEDKTALRDKINDIVTIDTLNNDLLCRFRFSLQDHETVCECLKRPDFSRAASCLIETMESHSTSIMNCFCDTLESLEDTADVAELLGLRDKYCRSGDVGM